jgi:hypothetical protein
VLLTWKLQRQKLAWLGLAMRREARQMVKKPGQGPTPLEADANVVLDQRVADFRQRMMAAAEEIYSSGDRGGGISGEDVEAAYKRLTTPDKRSRADAQKNVTVAFKENHYIQMVGYGMALVLFLSGVALLGYSAFGPSDAVGRIASLVGGSFAQVLLLIPLRFAVNARRSNFAIRILGHLLDRVDDPQLLAELIRRLIGEVAPGQHSGEVPN